MPEAEYPAFYYATTFIRNQRVFSALCNLLKYIKESGRMAANSYSKLRCKMGKVHPTSVKLLIYFLR